MRLRVLVEEMVVERDFAWASWFQRLVKDYERLLDTVAGLHFVAFACRRPEIRRRIERFPSLDRALKAPLSPAGFGEFVYATSEPAKERTLPPAPEDPPSEAEMEQLRALARQYGGELAGAGAARAATRRGLRCW